MKRYHISKDGVARVCAAQTPESCRAVNSEFNKHFTSREEAQQEYERVQEQKSNSLQGINKSNRRVLSNPQAEFREDNNIMMREDIQNLQKNEEKLRKDGKPVADNLLEQSKRMRLILENLHLSSLEPDSEKAKSEYSEIRSELINHYQKEKFELTKEIKYLKSSNNLKKLTNSDFRHQQQNEIVRLQRKREDSGARQDLLIKEGKRKQQAETEGNNRFKK